MQKASPHGHEQVYYYMEHPSSVQYSLQYFILTKDDNYDNILFKTKELHIIIKSHDVSGTVPLSINIIFELLMVKTTNVWLN